MFEGWVADYVVATLGRYLDVQKDKLRISLWSGTWRGGAGNAAATGCFALRMH
jgi:hypothetical protein